MAVPAFMRKHPKLWYYMLLVCAVTVCFLVSNSLMLLQGRDLVWTTDAQSLYMNFLTWWVETTRGIVADFFAGNAVEIPHFTYSLGYGADVPMTMGSYLQDPLNVVALAFPADQMGVAYGLMTWLRMVLAAVAFSEYCFYHGRGKPATALAALAYVGCGYVLFWGMMRHSKFIDWAVLMPLIFLGIDKMFDRKSPLLLGVAFALQFFISVYTAYMSCIAVFVYCLVKYFFAPRERSVRDFLFLAARVVAVVLVAFLISALFSLPQIGALLSQGRATSGSETDSLFTVKYYVKIPSQLIGADVTTNSLVIGAVSTFAAIAFVAGGKLVARDVRRPWQVALGLVAFGALVPFVGHVFNGMGYSTDRWGLLIGFVCAYVLALVAEVLPRFGGREWKRVFAGAGVVALLAAVFAFGQVLTEDGALGVVWPLCMTLAFVGVVACAKRLSAKGDSRVLCAALSVLVVACTSATCVFYASPLGLNWSSMFGRTGAIAQRIGPGSPAAPIDDLSDDAVFRFSYPCVYEGMKNSALTHGTMAIDFYSSFYNQKIDDFRQEMGIGDHYANISYVGSDSRLALDALAGVKYYVIKGDYESRLPASFEYAGVEKGAYRVYGTVHNVPLAFAASKVVNRADYEALSMAQRQEALLQGVLLEDGQVPSGMAKAKPSFSSQKVSYTVKDAKGLEAGGGFVRVNKKNAKLTLVFEGLPDSETYVCFDNLDARSYSPVELAEERGEQPSPADWVSQLGYRENRQYSIALSMNGNTHNLSYASDKHVRAGGKKNWIINMGHNERAQKNITVKFADPGLYTFDELSVVCQPAAPVLEEADALAARGLDDLVLETDRMSAALQLDDDKPVVAVFMVAHAPGWAVKVDGRDAQVLDADTGFLGVAVQGRGEHAIEWRYENPYARPGAWLSLAGLAVTAVFLLARAVLRARRGRHAAAGNR